MLCEKIIGSLNDGVTHAALAAQMGAYTVEEVPFAWFETHRRINRKAGENGTEVGIRLDDEAARRGIHDGDVLGVNVARCHVLVAHVESASAIVAEVAPGDVTAAARLAWTVGNTHTPLFAGDSEGSFLVPWSEPLKVALEQLPGVQVHERDVLLDSARQLSTGGGHGHSHGHVHAHGHVHGHGDAHAHEHGKDVPVPAEVAQ